MCHGTSAQTPEIYGRVTRISGSENLIPVKLIEVVDTV